MTDERQAVKTLAEQLVKAMKSVSANTPSKNYTNGTTPSTISASKIVGLPAAFSSIINGIEDAAAGGDAIAQMTLHALNHIAAGEFETITADTANIEKIYATFGDFITLVAEDATIGDLDVETIRAGLADVGLINIGSATISTAQIERASTGTLFVRDEVGGKVYIDDLAVSEANIVNLAAGTVLINNSNGELVELYVDATTGDVSTRTVSYDGSDIINQNSLSGNTIINNTLSGDAVVANSLNGNKIVSGSITTTQLNASEIFAAQGTIMDLIADNINVTRLFANQGFIQQLHTSIIGSDLSENSSIITLTDEINLMSSNTSRTFIQGSTPFPVHLSDTWFDPTTEEHYIAAGITISSQQMQFGHDDAGNLSNIFTDDYEFTINSNGELAVLIKDEDLEDIITEHNVDFGIKEGGYLSASGLWNKINNAAFSNLQVRVDGIISEVYDSEKGTSRIEQNADRIIAIVSGSQAVPYVKTNSIEIKEGLIEVKSSGNVDIKADHFSVSFNTEGSLSSSRVDISNEVGIRVSDRYGGYFQANYNKIGLYDMSDTPRLYMDANGQAFFNGSLTLGGVRNIDGSLTIRNENGAIILFANKNGIEIRNASGSTRQFYLDSSTGDATFAGTLNAAGGTFAGELRSSTVTSGAITVGGSSGGQITIKNSSNVTTGIWGSSGFTLYDSSGITPQVYLDGNTGNVIFAGELSAVTGTFAGELRSSTVSGGSITVGGSDNGQIIIKNSSNATTGVWGTGGFTLYNSNGTIPQVYLDGSTGDVIFAGSLSAAGGTFGGNIYTPFHATSHIYSQEYEGNISIGEDGLVINSHRIEDQNHSRYEAYLNGNVLGIDLYNDSTTDTNKQYSRLYATGSMDLRGGSVAVIISTYSDIDKRMFRLHSNQMYFYDRSGTIWFSVNENNFYTSATKSRLVRTNDYSDRLLYCYETPSPMFGDVGEGVISSDGQCYIPLDSIFAQTISTDQYQVFLQRYGEGDCYVLERHGSYFIVAGTPNLSFGWEIKAKQSDFDQLRLERNNEKFSVPEQTYGEEAASHIQELYNERTQQDAQ